MNNHGNTILLIVLSFILVLGAYWFFNSQNMITVAQSSVPGNSLVASAYNAYPAYSIYPAYSNSSTYPSNTASYSAYPTYSNSYVAPRAYVTYPIAKSITYSAPSSSSASYTYYPTQSSYSSYSTSSYPAYNSGAYPGSGNCYTQPDGSYTCTYYNSY